MVPRNFNATELLQVRRNPLRVEQHEFAIAQVLYQCRERNLGGISHAMKHGFTKESSANRDTVESAGKPPFVPSFDRVRVTELMQSCVAFDDVPIDPRIFPFRARSDRFGKRLVDCSFKYSPAQETSQRVRDVKIFQWQDRAWIGRKPFDRVVLHGHGENTEPIALQQKFWINHRRQCVKRWNCPMLSC